MAILSVQPAKHVGQSTIETRFHSKTTSTARTHPVPSFSVSAASSGVDAAPSEQSTTVVRVSRDRERERERERQEKEKEMEKKKGKDKDRKRNGHKEKSKGEKPEREKGGKEDSVVGVSQYHVSIQILRSSTDITIDEAGQ
ncbi:hypothetical protein HK102_002081 [Quaeritorhiza haematococci]|nr:hypothetical protein HK102_002081 [Quaeritorhiza haematococci]